MRTSITILLVTFFLTSKSAASYQCTPTNAVLLDESSSGASPAQASIAVEIACSAAVISGAEPCDRKVRKIRAAVVHEPVSPEPARLLLRQSRALTCPDNFRCYYTTDAPYLLCVNLVTTDYIAYGGECGNVGTGVDYACDSAGRPVSSGTARGTRSATATKVSTSTRGSATTTGTSAATQQAAAATSAAKADSISFSGGVAGSAMWTILGCLASFLMYVA